MGQERRGISMDQLAYMAATLSCTFFVAAMLLGLVWDIPYETPGLPPVINLVAKYGASTWIFLALGVIGIVFFWWMSTRRAS